MSTFLTPVSVVPTPPPAPVIPPAVVAQRLRTGMIRQLQEEATWFLNQFQIFWSNPVANAAAMGTDLYLAFELSSVKVAYINQIAALAGLTQIVLPAQGPNQPAQTVALPLPTGTPAGWTVTWTVGTDGKTPTGAGVIAATAPAAH